MKSLALLPLTTLVVFVFLSACKKENDVNQKNESSLRFSVVNPSPADVNSKPFTISYAGVYDKYLYMGITYTGGKVGHEFFVTWDGNVQDINAKKFIDLKVFHGNTVDDGTTLIADSLLLDISSLNISDGLRNDKSLYFNVINSSDLSNVIVVPAVYSNDGGNNGGTITNPTRFKKEVQVVSQECDKGAWGSLWLKGVSSDTCFLPKIIESGIVYTPALNDKLKITYERTWLADSTNICGSWQGKVVEIINIKALEKMK
ncbi:MAG: hypothetical protein HOO91_21465 [Bacteroidales bacterium]|nr:hypothetical protein [Bacteroidales bacterium]